MDRLKEKVAFITGSAAGIGRAAATLFSTEGAKVVVADIDEAGGKETCFRISDKGNEALFVQTDVTDPESVKASVNMTVEHFGKLDILYCNAGGSIGQDGSITDVTIKIWQETHAVDIFGTFLCCKFGLPELIKSGGGSVILTGSVAGLTGWRRSAYSSAKGAVMSLTRVMAVDYAKYGIRVNCVCPGLVINERTEAQIKKFPYLVKDMRPLHLLGFGEPIDIAYAALYLASDESRIVTGAIFPVDSGYTAIGRIDESDLYK
jgi:NAD(P)-dependent dehydrogenase (short-subunit alcohol dehydrogenase family)